jgi:hypothetical protein
MEVRTARLTNSTPSLIERAAKRAFGKRDNKCVVFSAKCASLLREIDVLLNFDFA